MTNTVFKTASISQYGTTEDFRFQVSRRKISQHTSFQRFGTNSAITTATETLWSYGGAYNWLAAATQLSVSSSSANDDGDPGGTGARTIQIIGLDANWEPIVEDVTMNGTSVVTTTNSFLRVLRAYVLTAGSTESNVGVIYIHNSAVTAGVPNTSTLVYGAIPAAAGQTQMAIHTIPAGYTGYIINLRLFSARVTSGYATFRLKQRFNDGTLDAVRVINQIDIANSSLALPYTVPIQISEKSDVWVDAILSTGTAGLQANFDMVVIKEVDPASVTVPGIAIGT